VRQRVELLWVGIVALVCRFVIRLEGGVDVRRLVDKIEYERVGLASCRSIQARECLYRLDARQALVDIHAVQQRLVKTCLVLLGHQQDLVFLRVELLRQLGFPFCLLLALDEASNTYLAL